MLPTSPAKKPQNLVLALSLLFLSAHNHLTIIFLSLFQTEFKLHDDVNFSVLGLLVYPWHLE